MPHTLSDGTSAPGIRYWWNRNLVCIVSSCNGRKAGTGWLQCQSCLTKYRGPTCRHHTQHLNHRNANVWACREFEKTHCPRCSGD